jgi:O-antigen ligase
MHNIYIERLAELGLVGFSLFVLLLIDYWRRIVAVRRNVTETDTSVLPGLRTKVIATGFEASMVANLAAGVLYNVVGASFFALLIANALFHMAWARNHDVQRPQPRPYRPLVSRLTT